MAGTSKSNIILNKTLHLIATLLNKYKLNNWFIGYGTLLGITRNNSCIDEDDDVDIIMDKKDVNKIITILKENNFINISYKNNFIRAYYNFNPNPNNISINSTLKNTFSSIINKKTYIDINNKFIGALDIYLADVDNNGNFNDTWENFYWTNCFDLIEKEWSDTKILLPNNYMIKLENLYGSNWKTPIKNYISPLPRKRII